MGIEIGEVQRAFGYAGAGALALKALDLLIKWRSGQRIDALSELEAARKVGAELRDELRKSIEKLQSENVALDTKLDVAEREVLALKAAHAKIDSEKKDVEAELRLIRKAVEVDDVRADVERRYADIEKDTRKRKGKS